MLKNKINTYFFKKFVDSSYEKISEIEEEEVYYRKNKLVVVVKNEDIGAQIYQIVKKLKEENEVINTENFTFKIKNYTSNEDNKIEMIYISITSKENWDNLSEMKKIQEFVKFAYEMQMKGYILDNSKFKNEKCNGISNILSFFSLNEGTLDTTNECLIKYIHYVFSNGGNLNEDYEKISKSGFCDLHEFPYNLPIIRMCYEYFSKGTFEVNAFEKNVLDILRDEEFESLFNRHYQFLLLDIEKFKSCFKLIEENEEYSLYEGNIKIYNNISSEFEKFILEKKYLNKSIEQVDTIVVDINEKIVGYKYTVEEDENVSTILEKQFKTQHELLSFIIALKDYVIEINSLKVNMIKKENNFNLEDSISYLNNSNSRNHFRVSEFNDLFNIIAQDKNTLLNQIVELFFKLLLKYLNEHYGSLNTNNQYFEKMEVRYLSPLLARAFVKYALHKNFDYKNKKISKEFITFLYKSKNTGVNECFYDYRFEYNPAEVPFLFEHEVDKKYNIPKLVRKKEEFLPDGRKIVLFSSLTDKKEISAIKSIETSVREEFANKFPDNLIYNDEFPSFGGRLKLVGLSEIIYSEGSLDNNDMYKVIGYITKPIKGKLLTNDVLANLNNKDFIKVAGYLYSKFNSYIIKDCIYMDDDFIFYIDIFDPNFRIIKNCNYFSELIDELINKYNCSSDKFIHLEDRILKSEEYLIKLANSLDVFCDEHKIYYDSKNEMCPICKKTKVFVKQNILGPENKIFEDESSVHYIFDRNHNIKVYKTSKENMALFEKNVNQYLVDDTSGRLLKSFQTLFIPLKKAFNEKKEFIGYIYNNKDFNCSTKTWNDTINLKDSKNWENLPKIKSLIRLMFQVRDIINYGFAFSMNPFGDVFLTKHYKKQVQILNCDYIGRDGNAEDTRKWTCQYVYDVINSDNTIDIKLLKHSMDLSFFGFMDNFDILLKKLQNLSNKLTKYCPHHKIYYDQDYIFCPMCVDSSKLKKIEVKKVSKDDITQMEQINEGGESIIYSYDQDTVAKVFKEHKDLDIDLKNRVILKLIEKKQVLEEVNKDKSIKYKYVTPKTLFVDYATNNIFAYTMERIEGTPISNLKNTDQVEALGFSRKDILEILITVGLGIENLHKNNIYIGDLNGRNILFDKNKNVYFLDFDGMGIDDISAKFCTDRYIDPISKNNKNITMKDDWYSFAVQAFYYLTFTHPFNGIYIEKQNGKEVSLNITDKMERRISLLGNHGMKAPNVAVPWDWMNRELKKLFLNIFENELRVSIVPELIKQYTSLYGSNSPNTIKVNSKFTATELSLFGDIVIKSINHFSAICENDKDVKFVSIIGKNKTYKIKFLPDCMQIKDIVLSENESVAFIIYENKVISYELTAHTILYKEYINHGSSVVVNGDTVYFLCDSDGENIIFKRNLGMSLNEKNLKEKIKVPTTYPVKHFLVNNNSKFIIVARTSAYKDEVYCNSSKLLELDYENSNSEYNIIYDSTTKLYLVINSDGNGVIIDSKSGVFEIIDFEINEKFNVKNITFNKGTIYIPTQGNLHLIITTIVINGIFVVKKKMECKKIMTPDSIVYDANNSGFNVLCNNTFYKVCKNV